MPRTHAFCRLVSADGVFVAKLAQPRAHEYAPADANTEVTDRKGAVLMLTMRTMMEASPSFMILMAFTRPPHVR
eukprot:4893714-Pleurochrysis_carterae.AAC.2